MAKQIFQVNDMNCNGCATTIRQGLESDRRINSIDINVSKKRVAVEGDLTPDESAQLIRDSGFHPEITVEKKGFFGSLFSR